MTTLIAGFFGVGHLFVVTVTEPDFGVPSCFQLKSALTVCVTPPAAGLDPLSDPLSPVHVTVRGGTVATFAPSSFTVPSTFLEPGAPKPTNLTSHWTVEVLSHEAVASMWWA